MAAEPTQHCPEFTRVIERAREKLPKSEHRAVDSHLATCPACLEAYAARTRARFPQLPQYTVIDRIGSGGFGVVYKAVHHHTRRVEAIKVLFEQSQSPARIAYFANEVQVAAALRHPNIATLYGAQLATPPFYFSMEFVDGRQLSELLADGSFSLLDRIALLREIAVAVGYAHEQGIAHRDLKPQNILIDAQRHPRILDFGIAKRLAAQPGDFIDHEGLLGTYGYIAPEQATRKPTDHRVDIYALGALLFHAVTGEHPRLVSRSTRIAPLLIKRHVTRARDLAAIIERCVMPDPAARYPNAELLVTDLDNYLQGRPVLARGDGGWLYSLSRVAGFVNRQYPVHVGVSIAACCGVLLTLLFWNIGARWFRAGSPGPPLALIAITPQTIEALQQGPLAERFPRANPQNRQTFRPIYGYLLERLAVAAPRAVAFDMYFHHCAPDFDEPFVAGIRGVGAPVVVGSDKFGVNFEPQLCPTLAAEVAAVGALVSESPGQLTTEWLYVLGIERGFEKPVPSLALQAFAAARHADARLELARQEDRLELRYAKKQFSVTESRYYADTDAVAFHTVSRVAGRHSWVQTGDKIVLGRYRLDAALAWQSEAQSLEDVLEASDETIRARFGGHVVLVGFMLPGHDEHVLKTGQVLYGCAGQAAALAAALRGDELVRYKRPEVAFRVVAACAGAVLLGSRLRVPRQWPVRAVLIGALGIGFCGLAAAAYFAVRVANPLAIELGMLGACLLIAGSLAALAAYLRERDTSLAPGATWDIHDVTIATTLLKTTRTMSQTGPVAGSTGA